MTQAGTAARQPTCNCPIGRSSAPADTGSSDARRIQSLALHHETHSEGSVQERPPETSNCSSRACGQFAGAGARITAVACQLALAPSAGVTQQCSTLAGSDLACWLCIRSSLCALMHAQGSGDGPIPTRQATLQKKHTAAAAAAAAVVL